MTKQLTREQSHALMTTLALNVDWSELDADLLQETVITKAQIAGRQFTAFLKVGARMPLSNLCAATVPFNVEKFVGKDWKIISEEQDKVSAQFKEIDLAKCDFVTCLKPGETRITGEEKLIRLKESKVIRYGATSFMGLWLDYQAKGESSILERLYRERGISYLDFFGDILLLPYGSRYVLCLCRYDVGSWNWDYDWLGNDWDANYQSLVSGQVS